MIRPWSVALVVVLGAAFACGAAADEFASPKRSRHTINAFAATTAPKTRLFIEAHDKSLDEVLALRRSLMERGAERVNLFVPDVIVCEVPDALGPAALVTEPGYTVYAERELGPNRVAAMSDRVRWAARSYELAWEIAHITTGSAPVAGPDEFVDVVRPVPPEVVQASRERRPATAVAAGFTPKAVDQNAEFLIGDVLVRLIMPESDGTMDANTEQWTDDELVRAQSGAVSACLAYQERFAYVPISFIFDPFTRVRTQYEPIAHNMETDPLWVTDVMGTLGVGEEKSDLLTVHTFNEQGRARYNTDWVYTAFIADSRNNPHNKFTDAFYTAYAGLGGPYLVIPFPASDNDPLGLGEDVIFSKIYQHEMGHIFWALDEYVAETNTSACSSRTGYLAYTHGNRVQQGPDGTLRGCPNYVPCIMWDPRKDDGRPVCAFTTGQIGLADVSPANDVPDVFDVSPTVEFMNSAVETVTTPEITLNIKAISLAKPNLNPFQALDARIDYAAPLRSAVLVVGGENAWLTPTDGRWDEPEEDLVFSFTGLKAGLTRVSVRVTNAFGRQSPDYVKKIYFVGLNYGQFDFNIVNNGIDLMFNLVGETFGATLDLYRSDGGEPLLIAAGLEGQATNGSPFTVFRYVDTDVSPGRTYSYYVKGSFDVTVKGVSSHFESLSNTFDVRAMVPMPKSELMSQGAPNPFRDRTSISVRVPETLAEPGNPLSGPQRVGSIPVPTRVEIGVYDVMGRLVRKLHQGSMFSQVFTVQWDGTNQNGEPASSGIYFVKAVAGPQTTTRKVVLVR